MTPVNVVQSLFGVIYVLLLIRVVLSWVPGINYHHPVVHFVYRVTSPILDPIRRAVPPLGGLDVSPFVAILLLAVVERVLIAVILQGAR